MKDRDGLHIDIVDIAMQMEEFRLRVLSVSDDTCGCSCMILCWTRNKEAMWWWRRVMLVKNKSRLLAMLVWMFS